MGELNKDPSIERWAAMREHTHFYYRFNRQKLLPTLVLLGVIPAGIAYYSLKGFVRTISRKDFYCYCRIGMKLFVGLLK